MYCVLVTGIPASGKSTMAEFLSKELSIPVISKDTIKELLFDDVGFKSREEKVRLGIASMNIMYYFAEKLMKCNQLFILENNFENISKDGLMQLLSKYSYKAITITLTGDYQKIYQRFLERNESPDRHRGHVVNDCYPEKAPEKYTVKQIPYEHFAAGIQNRGMDIFCVNGPQIIVDTTDFQMVNKENLLREISLYLGDLGND